MWSVCIWDFSAYHTNHTTTQRTEETLDIWHIQQWVSSLLWSLIYVHSLCLLQSPDTFAWGIAPGVPPNLVSTPWLQLFTFSFKVKWIPLHLQSKFDKSESRFPLEKMILHLYKPWWAVHHIIVLLVVSYHCWYDNWRGIAPTVWPAWNFDWLRMRLETLILEEKYWGARGHGTPVHSGGFVGREEEPPGETGICIGMSSRRHQGGHQPAC